MPLPTIAGRHGLMTVLSFAACAAGADLDPDFLDREIGRNMGSWAAAAPPGPADASSSPIWTVGSATSPAARLRATCSSVTV